MNSWNRFFRDRVERIFKEKHTIIDIGGGLRIEKSNRHEKENEWVRVYLPTVDYKVLDKVPDYQPDIVGDIRALPLTDNSVDAILCIAVLAHVEEPHKAVAEMYRVLKPGGYLFMYTPFIYYYHPEPGYYGDFFRFTYDGLEYLLRDFSSVDMEPVRGPIATLVNLIPLFSRNTDWVNWLDRLLYDKSRQVSGYFTFAIK
ncbi:MAG TPA: methyltransferase domain-containing protein [Candidatus Paceibacterota bacterium]|nr:methyltransferase domain-containing protein [Candidatus Paceibacterota bacterium]